MATRFRLWQIDRNQTARDDHPKPSHRGGEESFIHINRIAPVYPLTEGFAATLAARTVWRTLESKLQLKVAG